MSDKAEINMLLLFQVKCEDKFCILHKFICGSKYGFKSPRHYGNNGNLCCSSVYEVGFECILFLSAFVCVASTLDGCRYIDHFAISVYSEHL